MNSKCYVELYQSGVNEMLCADKLYSQGLLEDALVHFKSATLNFVHAIESAERENNMTALTEVHNLLVFVSIEADNIEEELENQAQ